MKRLIAKNSMDAYFTVPNQSVLEQFMQEHEIEFDNDYIIKMGNDYYQIRLEGWFPDCLESRGLGETNTHGIKQWYKDVMEQESGWTANIYGYMPNYPGTEYGVSYIGKKLS